MSANPNEVFPEATALGFGPEFKSAFPLWNAQVAITLEKYLSQQNSADMKGTSENNIVNRTLEYVRKLNNYGSEQTFAMANDLMTRDKKFTYYESALINNLNVGSVDEALTLIPSLRDKFPNSDQLNTILQQLAEYQKEDDTAAISTYQTSFGSAIDGNAFGIADNDDDDIGDDPHNDDDDDTHMNGTHLSDDTNAVMHSSTVDLTEANAMDDDGSAMYSPQSTTTNNSGPMSAMSVSSPSSPTDEFNPTVSPDTPMTPAQSSTASPNRPLTPPPAPTPPQQQLPLGNTPPSSDDDE